MIKFLLANGGYGTTSKDLRLYANHNWWVAWFEYEWDMTTSLNLML